MKSLINLLVTTSIGIISFLIGSSNVGAYYGNSCSDQYGIASYSIGNQCSCISGYSFGTDVFGRTQCINSNSACRDEFGYGSEATTNGKCVCSYRYAWNDTMTQCKYITCGLNSNWNENQKSCVCSSGYLKNTNGDCVRKDIPGVLTDFRMSDKNAILYTNQYGIDNFHQVKLGFGCVSMPSYLEKIILIKSSDEYIDTLDEINLPGADESCSILSSKMVSKNQTLKTCNDAYGSNSIESLYDDQSCVCKGGYQWNSKKDTCIITTKKTASCAKGYIYKNKKCQKASY